jgi:hypothetical protein
MLHIAYYINIFIFSFILIFRIYISSPWLTREHFWVYPHKEKFKFLSYRIILEYLGYEYFSCPRLGLRKEKQHNFFSCWPYFANFSRLNRTCVKTNNIFGISNKNWADLYVFEVILSTFFSSKNSSHVLLKDQSKNRLHQNVAIIV